MLFLTACVVIGVIIISTAKLSFWRYKCSQLMPGKKQSFFNILGDLIELIMFKNRGAEFALHLKFVEMLKNRSKSFQKQHLFCLWFTYLPFIGLIKADAVKELLTGNKLKEKSWVYDWMKPLFGNSIVTRPYAEWKPRRKLLNQCFQLDVVRGFIPSFNNHARKLVTFFQENGKQFVDITHPLQLCVSDIIYETVYDVNGEDVKIVESQFSKAIRRATEIFMIRLSKFWQWSEFIFWNTANGKEVKYHIKVLNDLADKVIQEKKERYFAAGSKIDKGRHQTFLDVLLQMHLDTHELTEEDVKHEVNVFAVGGHDTAVLTVSWALYLLGLSPDVQAKLHVELDSVFGEDADRETTEDDLKQLPYLDNVLKETLRLYPPIPIFGRQVDEDTTMCGHTLPKGASCFVLTYFLHRDEDVFPDPEKFDPDRFLPENFAKIPEFAYIPFSAGPRNCIASRYAIMEVKILLSAILRNFTVESLDDRSKVLPVIHITLPPSTPIYIKFRSRRKQC